MTIAIVSGYFNPTHLGHLRMMQEARALADGLIVIVNNDVQQVLKKGRVILPEAQRLELVAALRIVDRAVLSWDVDPTVRVSLQRLAEQYPEHRLIFCNGGDRNAVTEIPETEVCKRNNIELRFGVGGDFKTDSSTRLIAELESA